MLASGVDPCAREGQALRIAAACGHADVVALLLSDGRSDPRARNQEALISAARKDQQQVCALLLDDPRVEPAKAFQRIIKEKPRNMVRVSSYGTLNYDEGSLTAISNLIRDPRVDPSEYDNMALTRASELGNVNLVEALMRDERVRPTAASLAAVCYSGNLELLRFSIADERCDNDAKNGALDAAYRMDNIEAVRLLLEDRSFHLASEDFLIGALYTRFRPDLLRVLLADPRVDPSVRQNAILAAASRNGDVEIVRSLLADNRVDPSSNNSKALVEACGNIQLGVFRLLMEDGRVDPSAGHNRAIIAACEHGNMRHQASCLEIVRSLLNDERVDPSAQDNAAIRRGVLPRVAELLLMDHRVTPPDELLRKTLNFLERTESIELAMVLINDGRVDPTPLLDGLYSTKVRDRRSREIRRFVLRLLEKTLRKCLEHPQLSRTAKELMLKFAAEIGINIAVEVLLSSEDIDPCFDEGALIRVASLRGNFNVVRLLLEDGRCDPAAKDCSSLRQSYQKGHLTVTKLLLSDASVFHSKLGPKVESLKVVVKVSVEVLVNIRQRFPPEVLELIARFVDFGRISSGPCSILRELQTSKPTTSSRQEKKCRECSRNHAAKGCANGKCMKCCIKGRTVCKLHKSKQKITRRK